MVLSKVIFGVAFATSLTASLSAGDAKAAVVTTCSAPSNLSVGDKTVTNIVCNGVGDETEIRFNSFGLLYDFGSVIDPPTQAGSISYTINIIDPEFEFASVGLDSGCVAPSLGSCTITKNINWTGGFATLTSSNGAPAPFDYLFAPNITTLNIEDVFSASGLSAISTVNNFFVQRPAEAPPESVPGPLPIFGAGAAFGFSRKLRSRIKKSTAIV